MRRRKNDVTIECVLDINTHLEGARACRLRRFISLVERQSPIEEHFLEFAVHHAYLYLLDISLFDMLNNKKKCRHEMYTYTMRREHIRDEEKENQYIEIYKSHHTHSSFFVCVCGIPNDFFLKKFY